MVITVKKRTARTERCHSWGILHWDFSRHLKDMRRECSGILESIKIEDFNGTLDEAILALQMMKSEDENK